MNRCILVRKCFRAECLAEVWIGIVYEENFILKGEGFDPHLPCVDRVPVPSNHFRLLLLSTCKPITERYNF
jgi:hypothetical protein